MLSTLYQKTTTHATIISTLLPDTNTIHHRAPIIQYVYQSTIFCIKLHFKRWSLLAYNTPFDFQSYRHVFHFQLPFHLGLYIYNHNYESIPFYEQ